MVPTGLPNRVRRRYTTWKSALTGATVGDTIAIADIQTALDELAGEYRKPDDVPPPPRAPGAGGSALPDDEELIRKAKAAKNGEKFRRLWSGDTSDRGKDDSAADPGATIPVADHFAGCVAYTVRGESMTDEHIVSGDYVIVREQADPPAGSVVVAWIKDMGATIKKLDGKGYLRSRSSKERWSHKLSERDRILGALVGVIRLCE